MIWIADQTSKEAPEMNPNYNLITGNICGIKVQEIENPLMQKIRYLNKVVDTIYTADRQNLQ